LFPLLSFSYPSPGRWSPGVPVPLRFFKVFPPTTFQKTFFCRSFFAFPSLVNDSILALGFEYFPVLPPFFSPAFFYPPCLGNSPDAAEVFVRPTTTCFPSSAPTFSLDCFLTAIHFLISTAFLSRFHNRPCCHAFFRDTLFSLHVLSAAFFPPRCSLFLDCGFPPVVNSCKSVCLDFIRSLFLFFFFIEEGRPLARPFLFQSHVLMAEWGLPTPPDMVCLPLFKFPFSPPLEKVFFLLGAFRHSSPSTRPPWYSLPLSLSPDLVLGNAPPRFLFETCIYVPCVFSLGCKFFAFFSFFPLHSPFNCEPLLHSMGFLPANQLDCSDRVPPLVCRVIFSFLSSPLIRLFHDFLPMCP